MNDNKSLSVEEYVYQVNLAIAIAWTSVASAVFRPGSTNVFSESKDLSTGIVISGILSIISLALFGN